MLEIINSPELGKCTIALNAGEPLFLEGDDSTDMYVLVSGRLEVLKDNKKISEITEPGSLVGEMSFLLGGSRTATVRAVTSVRAIHVQGDRIEGFLREFPALAPQITLNLARRLRETTRVVHGLKEFSDQLPDAVIMTDRDRNILSWNRAAERLHGRTWKQMNGQPLAEVYNDPSEYQEFIADIMAGRSLTERILEIRHPDGDRHYVSTSTTVLYDGHHNIEGYLFLGRDVTKIRNLEDRYRRVRNWFIPAIALICLSIAALIIAYPHFSKGVRILDLKKQEFRDRINIDHQKLTGALAAYLDNPAQPGVRDVLAGYFEGGGPGLYCIKGTVLLDQDKKVVNAYVPGPADAGEGLIGTNYSGIQFRGENGLPYRFLTLFRADPENPMGTKGIEIAFALDPIGNTSPSRWLLFQLDIERLGREFGLDEDSLEKIRFLQE